MDVSAQPPAPSKVEACCGLAPSAVSAVAWHPIVCNVLSALGEPFHHPQGSAAGGHSQESASLHVSGEHYNDNFQPL